MGMATTRSSTATTTMRGSTQVLPKRPTTGRTPTATERTTRDSAWHRNGRQRLWGKLRAGLAFMGPGWGHAAHWVGTGPQWGGPAGNGRASFSALPKARHARGAPWGRFFF